MFQTIRQLPYYFCFILFLTSVFSLSPNSKSLALEIPDACDEANDFTDHEYGASIREMIEFDAMDPVNVNPESGCIQFDPESLVTLEMGTKAICRASNVPLDPDLDFDGPCQTEDQEFNICMNHFLRTRIFKPVDPTICPRTTYQLSINHVQQLVVRAIMKSAPLTSDEGFFVFKRLYQIYSGPVLPAPEKDITPYGFTDTYFKMFHTYTCGDFPTWHEDDDVFDQTRWHQIATRAELAAFVDAGFNQFDIECLKNQINNSRLNETNKKNLKIALVKLDSAFMDTHRIDDLLDEENTAYFPLPIDHNLSRGIDDQNTPIINYPGKDITSNLSGNIQGDPRSNGPGILPNPDVNPSDKDRDGLIGNADNCPNFWNPDQLDTDSDGLGDMCDPDIRNNRNTGEITLPPRDGGANTIILPPRDGGANGMADSDNDGYADSADNCPAFWNPDQLDTDSDGLGDMCDPDIRNRR